MSEYKQLVYAVNERTGQTRLLEAPLVTAKNGDRLVAEDDRTTILAVIAHGTVMADSDEENLIKMLYRKADVGKVWAIVNFSEVEDNDF